MNKQAYINGFVKRANEYGYTAEQALELLKQANPGYYEQTGANLGHTAGKVLGGGVGGIGGAIAGAPFEAIPGVGTALGNAAMLGGGYLGADKGGRIGGGLGGFIGKGVDHVMDAAGNFVANHPKLEQGLQNYADNYGTAMNATKGGGPSLLRPMLRPIAANLAAAHEAINPAVK